MSKLVELLTKRVRDALAPRGAPAEICRKTGLSRTQVQRWFKEPVNPTIETLDKVAHALGAQPWELIRPEGAEPTPRVREHTLADCKRAVDAALERQMKADAEKRKSANTGRSEEDGDGDGDAPEREE